MDRFINLGYSGAAGISADKYGWKGLGSKLMYNCRKLSIATWTGKPADAVYMVEVHEPRSRLLKDTPEWPKAYLTKRQDEATDQRGTTIRVYGFEGGKTEYPFEVLRRYLYWNTVAGITRDDPLPTVILKVGNHEEKLATGYPFIRPSKPDDTEAWKTVVVDPPHRGDGDDPPAARTSLSAKGWLHTDHGERSPAQYEP